MQYAHNSKKVNTKYVLFSELFSGLFGHEQYAIIPVSNRGGNCGELKNRKVRQQ